AASFHCWSDPPEESLRSAAIAEGATIRAQAKSHTAQPHCDPFDPKGPPFDGQSFAKRLPGQAPDSTNAAGEFSCAGGDAWRRRAAARGEPEISNYMEES